jgi:hypothetical protein
MLIFGKGLDSPISIPARDRKQNSIDVIMNEIDKLEISDKKVMLLSNPMQIIITTITPPKGKGKNQTKFIDNNEKGRIRIKNNDDKCLFHAVEMARIFANAFDKNLKRKFYRLINNANRQKEIVDKFLSESSINHNKRGNSINEVSLIQNYYDIKYPGQYRLILFQDENIYLKPIWKGPRFRTHNLILYLEKGHFDIIKSVPQFFKLKRKYCLECEITYSRFKILYYIKSILNLVINIIEKIAFHDVICALKLVIFHLAHDNKTLKLNVRIAIEIIIMINVMKYIR